MGRYYEKRYCEELLPAHDEFSDKLKTKVDHNIDFNVIGLNVWSDVIRISRELIHKAYKAGYADCKDDYARGNTNV